MSLILEQANGGSFDPAAIAVMSKAYELGCAAIEGQPESDKERLARLIVELAKDGERDLSKLCIQAVNAMYVPN